MAFHKHTSSRNRLFIALGLGLVYMLAAAVGSWLSGSLALLADAGHFILHNGALFIAILAATLAAKKADDKFPQGYGRVDALGSYTNGLLLLGVACFIFYSAAEPYLFAEHLEHAGEINPEHGHVHDIDGTLMGMIALFGLVLHGLSAWVLHGGRKESLNVHAVYLHLLYDVVATITTLIAGVVIEVFHFHEADKVAGVVIAILIARSALSMLKRSAYFLMDGLPEGVNYKEVCKTLKKVSHIKDVHQVVIRHGSKGLSLSAHLVIDDKCASTDHWKECQEKATSILKDQFNIQHTVLQLEIGEHEH